MGFLVPKLNLFSFNCVKLYFMIQKTEAIVLRTQKYQDSNLIARLYTQKFGAKSFMLSGYGSARTRTKYSYFQPLSIVEIVFMEKAGVSLHKISESQSLAFLQNAQTDPIKLAIGLSIMEIFYDCVKDEEPDEATYQLLKTLILELDAAEDKIIHLFFYFLVQLTKVLGFFPNNEVKDNDKNMVFNIQTAMIQNGENGNHRFCQLLLWFMYANVTQCREVTFSQQEKKEFLANIFSYYYEHIHGFKYPKTLQVFAEILG